MSILLLGSQARSQRRGNADGVLQGFRHRRLGTGGMEKNARHE